MPAGVTDATNSTVVADPTAVMPDGSDETTVTISLIDSEEDPIGRGHLLQVSISQEPAGVTLSDEQVVSDDDGQAAVTVKSNTIHTASAKTEIEVIDLTDGVVLSTAPEIDFFPIIDQTNSSVVVSTSPAAPDETDEVTITVTAKDANDDPIVGLQVSLEAIAQATGVVISPAHDDTDENGVVVFTATSTTAHAATVFQATDDDNSIVFTQTATGVFRELVDASESTVEASAESGTCDGVDVVTVTVTCLDGNGDPVPSVPVTLTASTNGTGAVVNGESEAATVTADANGVAVFSCTCAGTTHGGRGGTTYTAVAGQEAIAITEDVTVLWFGTLAASLSTIAFEWQNETPLADVGNLQRALTISGTPAALSAVSATASAAWIDPDAEFTDGVAGVVAVDEAELPAKDDGDPVVRSGTITFAHMEYTSLVIAVKAERYPER